MEKGVFSVHFRRSDHKWLKNAAILWKLARTYGIACFFGAPPQRGVRTTGGMVSEASAVSSAERSADVTMA
jgi:hypothetical protein